MELGRRGPAVGQITSEGLRSPAVMRPSSRPPQWVFPRARVSSSLRMRAQAKFCRYKGDPVSVLVGAEPDRNQAVRTRV